jgi:predicted DNA-binding protein YlxM (UPF0122 family)
MTKLTSREREIMRLLKDGRSIPEIAKTLKVPRPSISRSIASIKLKLYEIKTEIDFLTEIGFITIENGVMKYAARDMDPRVLAKKGFQR